MQKALIGSIIFVVGFTAGYELCNRKATKEFETFYSRDSVDRPGDYPPVFVFEKILTRG